VKLLVPLAGSWLPHSENPDVHPTENESLNKEMHSKILRSSFGLRMPNPILGRREAAGNLFVKQIPPKDSWHQMNSGRCNFHLLMLALTLDYWTAGKIVLVWNCHSAWRHHKLTICTSLVQDSRRPGATPTPRNVFLKISKRWILLWWT
jgi:hypothetical protein